MKRGLRIVIIGTHLNKRLKKQTFLLFKGKNYLTLSHAHCGLFAMRELMYEYIITKDLRNELFTFGKAKLKRTYEHISVQEKFNSGTIRGLGLHVRLEISRFL